MRLTNRVIPGLVAGSLLLGTASGVLAAKPKKHAHAKAKIALVAGQVSNLSTTGFTLTFTPKKAGATPTTWQIATTATTKEIAAKGTTGALVDNDYAIVIGARTAAASTAAPTAITARNVRFSTTAFKARTIKVLRLRLQLNRLTAPKAHNVRGAVVAASTSATTLTLTVTNKAGSKTVAFALTAKTRYFNGKTRSTTPLTFTDGEKVAVRFVRPRGSTTLNALVVHVPAATPSA